MAGIGQNIFDGALQLGVGITTQVGGGFHHNVGGNARAVNAVVVGGKPAGNGHTQFLPRWGITFDWLNGASHENWQKAVKPNTKMLFLETPSNPGLDVIDLVFAGKFAKENSLIFNVDNCFATPYLQQPAKFGADLITHSATKFIDGQGRVLGGVVVGNKEQIAEVRKFCRSTGPSLSPFNAWDLPKDRLKTCPSGWMKKLNLTQT